ncbi:MAG: uroporphyrinogen-III C-methyltransferase [Deltaproteobacteria bacterium]|nr:uroporphyrinogen-III C-methyltransferase [Deltaproteobacteria bacterium]
MRAAGRVAGDARGFVSLVGAGPGDPELITLRGWRALQSADVVVYDALVEPALLREVSAPLIDAGKRCGRHGMSQEAICALLVELALAGKRVVRLKGGDPNVLGRVGEEALALGEAGVRFEIVPGVTSATAVPSAAGIPVTHRGLADSFVVLTAHRQGEHATLSIPTYDPRTTVVLLMARGTVAAWREQLLRRGYPEDLPLAVISAGCTPRQRVVETTVAGVPEAMARASLDAPVLAIAGWVVTLRAELASGVADRAPAFECPAMEVGEGTYAVAAPLDGAELAT